MAALVERAAASGVAVTLDGDLAPLPPMADRAAYRVVQEALTNVAKHAPGAPVTVRLGMDSAGREAVITVANAAPPAGPLPDVRSGGHGLVSLDERVRITGGRLHTRAVGGGFEVTARLPLTAGAATTSPESQRELARARRKVRRSLIDAVWAVAAGAALLGLLIGYERYTADRSVLDATRYQELRIGDDQSTVQSGLPAYQATDANRPRGAAPDPPGTDECQFYRTRAHSVSPVYRLCFTDGKLSHKDELTLAQT